MAGAMMEIRWHGRGGQGAKTAATLVAMVALEEGKFSQGFPEYGPERMGAPVKGYTRISDDRITLHCGIERPDVVVVLDATLLDTVDVCEGIKEGGVVIVNSNHPPAQIRSRLKGAAATKVFTVDATQIALDEIGRPIPNTPMMGALITATGVLTMETLLKDLKKKFSKKFPEKVVQGNIRAVERAAEEVKAE